MLAATCLGALANMLVPPEDCCGKAGIDEVLGSRKLAGGGSMPSAHARGDRAWSVLSEATRRRQWCGQPS